MGEDGHPSIKFICKDCGGDMKCISDRGNGKFLYTCTGTCDRRDVEINVMFREMKI